MSDLSWQDDALCAQTDPEAFFPEKGGSTRESKRTCMACEVRAECLEYALNNEERFGVWGGLSERERRRVQKNAIVADDRPAVDKRAERDEEIREARANGIPVSVIAKDYGLSTNYVRQIVADRLAGAA